MHGDPRPNLEVIYRDNKPQRNELLKKPPKLPSQFFNDKGQLLDIMKPELQNKQTEGDEPKDKEEFVDLVTQMQERDDKIKNMKEEDMVTERPQ